jgi:hypothetical protein
MQKLIDKYPTTTFMVACKVLWITGFFWSVFVIQGEVPSLKQWLLGSLYVIVTLPVNYWLTYCFSGKKDD